MAVLALSPYLPQQLCCRNTSVATSQVEQEAKYEPYEEKEAMKDYSEIVVQYGFVTLFVAAYPLCPLLALINNNLEMHVDGYKLCHSTRRPTPHQADSVGVWSSFMSIQSNISVISNMALVCFTSSIFANYSMSTKVPTYLLSVDME